MANKCQNLKKLECNLQDTQNSDLKQILSSIKAFPALKRFNLKMFAFDVNFCHHLLCKDMFSFEAFKGLSNITHLTLYCDFLLFKEKSLKDIDIILPNLQYLVIDNRLNLNREEVTQMADILSRLSKLKIFKFQIFPIFNHMNNNEMGIIFREKCKKLQTFEINPK